MNTQARHLAVLLLLLALTATGTSFAAEPQQQQEKSPHWYKGQTHMHSCWSDGEFMPEMAAQSYKSLGYDFITPSDHNTIQSGEKWRRVGNDGGCVPNHVFDQYLKMYGDDWVETRNDENGCQEVRLKRFEEVREKVGSDDFIIIRSTEITGRCGTSAVHVNAINIEEPIQPQSGENVADTIRRDIAKITDQAMQLERPIANHVNHPAWRHYDIAPEDLAAVPEATAFEICNYNAGSNYYGNAIHPSLEKFWDIANTLRITQGNPPIFGVANDDTHAYTTHYPTDNRPGRAFIMVRADELSPHSIVRAMNNGDYYSSTGTELTQIDFDKASGRYAIAVKPEPDVTYCIDFIGTRKEYDRTTRTVEVPADDKHPARTVTQYSGDIGQTLHSATGTTATYQLKGDELYVRAIIYSNRPHDYPAPTQQENEMAWTQPVGWRK